MLEEAIIIVGMQTSYVVLEYSFCRTCDDKGLSHRKWSLRDINTSLCSLKATMEGIYLSSASYLLLAALALIVLGVVGDKFLRNKKRRVLGKEAPGPKPWPVIGSLHLLGGYEIPYQAFDVLSDKYGPVFAIKLGQVQCLVISNLKHIREVLFNKGDMFDGRPNFTRYHQLFGGDKENSLAFCDWSETQKTRRDMLKDHAFPKVFTERFHQLNGIINIEMHEMCTQLKGGVVYIKPLMLRTVANIFMSYICSSRFPSDDPEYVKMVENFDSIFYEVNQGYAADFIPWLMPLLNGNLRKMSKWSKEIKDFIVGRIIQKRLDNWAAGQEAEDYVDALINHIKDPKATMSLETALFALEDIIGGHSAIANLIVKVLGFVSQAPEVQEKIQKEIDYVSAGREITLEDRSSMPYTEATILEAVRHITSPIIPHVANQQCSLAGYTVEKDTLIFLNNYTLNMSPELWSEPTKFMPDRFLNEDGKISKPEHFLPFGGGRRSCMGYKLTQFISFVTLATLLQRFHLVPVETYKVPLGNLAISSKSKLQLNLIPR
ncbi:cytochrome P450 307a1-like isoform X2 [Cimex lectularius]|uniref:Cytochrome P450 n=1 Tax=Cimex lectularius TaxID=79782 RepID=A0A8I6RX85_CIMLE|nr:cytochrome P450 307a1-like isoform X2 [Cimex lectularius]